MLVTKYPHGLAVNTNYRCWTGLKLDRQEMGNKRVAYISSPSYVSLCSKHPKTKNRASMVDSLIKAYNLLTDVLVVQPKPASKHDILLFHSEEYVSCLEKLQLKINEVAVEEEDSDQEITYDLDDLEVENANGHGFGYDCAVFDCMYDYTKAVTGATLQAAELLMTGTADISVNLHGGWHHAHVDEAAGFCYVNDVVIGILKLASRFKRILYIDLDIHHGDGVEEAFQYSKKVMTLSLHKLAQGYFPGTGCEKDIGAGLGRYFCINVPLKDGVDDAMYHRVFQTLFSRIIDSYDPEVIVTQCGADSLSHDPLGGFNLSGEGVIDCVRDVCNQNKPVIILGGGGYNFPNTARFWTQLMASIVGKTINADLPDHRYIERYGPDYTISISKSNRRNENTETYISKLLEYFCSNIEKMKGMEGRKLEKAEIGALDNKENDSRNKEDFPSYVNKENRAPLCQVTVKAVRENIALTKKTCLSESNNSLF